MDTNLLSNVSSLEEYLKKGSEQDFPPANQKKEYYSRAQELDKYFSEYSVEMGAMKNEIDEWKKTIRMNLEEATKIENGAERAKAIDAVLGEDDIIFLNKHGKEHVDKVREKAFEILKCFTGEIPSYYEVFFLLCSISVHDVGNIYGRAGHEKQIGGMLKEACKNIIDDSVEQRVIARIAGVHGGVINNSKDTISAIKKTDIINNFPVREQMLASILRFADELADDNTRANDPALRSGILGNLSEIFHIYSSKLHTVKLQSNPVNAEWKVVLKYEFDESTAKKRFSKGSSKVYLLDEIYERTIKMERERRYCMRFLRPYCSIESIDVEITIESDESVFDQETIKYTLVEKGYPDAPYKTIKDVNNDILTGSEMAQKLSH